MQLARFCLYGFLKNQRPFEPFLILIFLDRGLSFTTIGILVAIREIVMNLLELLSGALADTWGRRRAMVASMTTYIIAFILFSLTPSKGALQFIVLAVAMGLYGAGDAFRSGTHKAMILTWLRQQDRTDERTRIYGLTRSWSKIGSATSVAVGAAWVLLTGDLESLFLLALPAYLLGLINLATYPKSLDGEQVASSPSIRATVVHLRQALAQIAQSQPLRGLLLESSAFMGTFKATRDYLQPILQAAATTGWVLLLGTTATAALDSTQRTALLIGPVYLLLFLWSAAMSRRADHLVQHTGHEDTAARWLWTAFTLCFLVLLPAALLNIEALLIIGFMALYAFEALWRPIIITRIDAQSTPDQGATLLSVESQARSIATMILAPLLGAAVDFVTAAGQPSWWPVALLGLWVGLLFIRHPPRHHPPDP
ncbi:MAG: MFS transporter [Myxococcota bacterium]